MKVKGLTDFYYGDWRLQLSYPNFDFVTNFFNPYKGITRDTEWGFASDLISFRYKRLYSINTKGSVYSYFSFGIVVLFGLGVDYLAGRGETRRTIKKNAESEEQKEKVLKMFGIPAR